MPGEWGVVCSGGQFGSGESYVTFSPGSELLAILHRGYHKVLVLKIPTSLAAGSKCNSKVRMACGT